MQVGPRVLRKGYEKIGKQLDCQVTNFAHANSIFVNCQSAASQIYRSHCQGFVHRHYEITGAVNADSFAQRAIEQLSQNNTHVFDGVVLIHVQVAFGGQFEVKPAVSRKESSI